MEAEILNKKKIIAPKLRFKEFYKEWNNKKLGELVLKMQSGISRKLNDTDVGFPILRSNNIQNGKLDVSDIKYWYLIDEQGANLQNYILKQDDILVNFINSLAQIGKVAIFENLLKRDTIFTTNILRLCIQKSTDSRFIYYNFNTRKYVDFVQSITKPAVNQASFTTKEFQNYLIACPPLPEQQKIASFLSAVDEKLQQLTHKKELLEQYKKGVMQQLFSSKLRFRDENGKMFPKWEEKRLGDVCTFFSGGTPASTNKSFYSGTIPFIGSGNIYDSEVFSFITEEALNSSSAKMVMKGDLLYALYGANSGEVAISKIKGAINQAILCIRSNEEIEYLYFVLLLNKDRIVAKYLQGGQGNLSANIIKRLKYKLPSVNEQKMIADYLSLIDKKTESIKKQIIKTQTFKKGLLQQMFV